MFSNWTLELVVKLLSTDNALTQQSFTVVMFSVIMLTLSLFQPALWLQDLIFKHTQLALQISKSLEICH